MESSEISAYVRVSFCMSVQQSSEIFKQFTDIQEKYFRFFKLKSHPTSQFLIFCNNQNTDDAQDTISI